MLDDSFLSRIPSDPCEAIQFVCQQFYEMDCAISYEEHETQYGFYVEAFAVLEAILELHGMTFSPPQFGDDKGEIIRSIREFFQQWLESSVKALSHKALIVAREKAKHRLGTSFAYQFSDGDLAKVQAVINELRSLLASAAWCQNDHKQRMLKKLELLQQEVHKRMSSLDKFWGLLGDAGVMIGRFGNDAKPFVDRVKELSEIIWRTQARSEELQSGLECPLLTHNEFVLDKNIAS